MQNRKSIETTGGAFRMAARMERPPRRKPKRLRGASVALSEAPSTVSASFITFMPAEASDAGVLASAGGVLACHSDETT